jgi:hypothetical protein
LTIADCQSGHSLRNWGIDALTHWNGASRHWDNVAIKNAQMPQSAITQ